MRHHDESTSLLPESRDGSNYDAVGRRRHHHHPHHHARPKSLFPRLAGLVVVGVAVAIMVAATVVSRDTRGGRSGVSSDLPPATNQPPTSFSENENNLATHAETPTGSTLRIGGAEDGKANHSGGGGGGDGGEEKSEAAEEEAEQTAPNVIFVLVDDLGMNDMGSSSTDMAEATPFIDSLAKVGVRLTTYYSNHICTPARVSRDGVYRSLNIKSVGCVM